MGKSKKQHALAPAWRRGAAAHLSGSCNERRATLRSLFNKDKRQPKRMPQEGWLWERTAGKIYGSTWKRRWCEVTGARFRIYDEKRAREVATIHIRAETTLIDRLTEDEVRRVGRAPQAGDAAVYFRLVDRVGGRSPDFAAESEADAARWISAITSGTPRWATQLAHPLDDYAIP